MALSLSAPVKVGGFPWRLSVEGGCFGELTPLLLTKLKSEMQKMVENGILW